MHITNLPFGATNWLLAAGESATEFADGHQFVLRPGMSYQVADGAEAHRSGTVEGATLFVMD